MKNDAMSDGIPVTSQQVFDEIRMLTWKIPPPLESIKLTRQQIQSLRHDACTPSDPRGYGYFGVPVYEVATYEESTPCQHALERARQEGRRIVEWDGAYYAIDER